MGRRPKYSGSIYLRGDVYQIQYVVDGIRHRESAKTDNKEEAQKLLNKRLSEATEKPVKNTTCAALAELYMAARRARWKPDTYDWTKTIWTNHLAPAFGARNPASILPGDIDLFVTQQKEKKLSECYINRSLVILKAVLRYGVKNKALREIPEFPDQFDERPYVRQGHIDWWTFYTFVQSIPDDEAWLEALVTLAFMFGFRRGELVYMRVGQVDFDHKRINLPPGSTKNKMPKTVYFNPTGAAGKILKQMVKGKRPEQYLFSRDDGSTPVRDFRVSFDKAALAANITTGSGKNGKLTFHDLRRSAITRMDDLGLSEKQSMAVAGHLSPDVHRRYKIISENSGRKIAEMIDPDVK